MTSHDQSVRAFEQFLESGAVNHVRREDHACDSDGSPFDLAITLNGQTMPLCICGRKTTQRKWHWISFNWIRVKKLKEVLNWSEQQRVSAPRLLFVFYGEHLLDRDARGATVFEIDGTPYRFCLVDPEKYAELSTPRSPRSFAARNVPSRDFETISHHL